MDEPQEVLKAQKQYRDQEIYPRIKAHLRKNDKLSQLQNPDEYLRMASQTMLLYARSFAVERTNYDAEQKMARGLYATADEFTNEPLTFVYKQAKLIGWLEESGVVEEIMQGFEEDVIPVINKEYSKQIQSDEK